MDLSLLLARPLVVLCAISGLASLASWLRPDSRGRMILGESLGAACLSLCLTAWALRWWQSGHFPMLGTYESSLSLALAALLGTALVRPKSMETRARRLRPVGCALAAALVAHGLFFDPSIYPLTVSLRAPTVIVHAVLAWSAFGSFTAATGLAFLVLIRGSKVVDEARRIPFLLGAGLLLHSAMIATGSFYRFKLVGRAWSFDPIETLSLAIWVAFGAVLLMHFAGRLKCRSLAVCCIGLILLLVVSYRGISFFPAESTYHGFDRIPGMDPSGPKSP